MREIELIPEESTATSFVFTLKDSGIVPAESEDAHAPVTPDASSTPPQPEESTDHEKQFFLEITPTLAATLREILDATPLPHRESDTTVSSTDHATGEKNSEEKPSPPRADTHKQPPLRMRLRDIQESIRRGATIAEIAELNDVPESRIEPYARPIMLEKAKKAEIAKNAYPILAQGPSTMTLCASLAATLAARGHSLADTTWDAVRDETHTWTVFIHWNSGLTTNTVGYILVNHTTSSLTAEPIDSLSADMVDPSFMKPVRRVTTHNGLPFLVDTDDIDSDNTEEIASHENTEEDIAQCSQRDSSHSVSADENFLPPHSEKSQEKSAPSTTDTSDAQKNDSEGLLLYPKPTSHNARKRRKASTPHWEDILLGVRTDRQRPKPKN